MILKDDIGVVGGKFTNPNMHLSIEKDNFNNQKLILLASGQKGDDHYLIKVDLMGEIGGVNGGGSSHGNASFKKNEFEAIIQAANEGGRGKSISAFKRSSTFDDRSEPLDFKRMSSMKN